MVVYDSKIVGMDSRINQITMADISSEKAGVGGSIPSLATMFSTTYKPAKNGLRSITFHKSGTSASANPTEQEIRS